MTKNSIKARRPPPPPKKVSKTVVLQLIVEEQLKKLAERDDQINELATVLKTVEKNLLAFTETQIRMKQNIDAATENVGRLLQTIEVQRGQILDLTTIVESQKQSLEEKDRQITELSSLLSLSQQQQQPLEEKKTRLDKPIVVIDINGVLLDKERVVQRWAPIVNTSDNKTVISSSNDGVWTVLTWRTGAAKFLKFLNDKFHVVIWSSALEETIHNMLKAIGIRPENYTILSQEHCRAVPIKGRTHPLFMKPIETLTAKFEGATARDVFVVDDSPEKYESFIYDHIIHVTVRPSDDSKVFKETIFGPIGKKLLACLDAWKKEETRV
jgi:hypothetical protein